MNSLVRSPAPQPAQVGPFPAWPHYDAEERAAVDAVLASGKVNYWTGGEVRKFESEYAEHLQVSRAIGLMNGTSSRCACGTSRQATM
jgi:dTDP-4-amino-4,6-dideoxygalactose transaminase